MTPANKILMKYYISIYIIRKKAFKIFFSKEYKLSRYKLHNK